MRINETSSIERITVEQAKTMLDNMVDRQRKVRETFVCRLVEEMKLGKFRLSSDAILLIKGKLANGQHRLSAVIRSGLSQVFIIMRTRDERLFEILDCGIPRSVADVLAHDGFNHTRDQAAIAKFVVMYDKGLLTRYGWSQKLEQKDEEGRKYWKTWTRGGLIEYARINNESLSKIAHFVAGLYRKHKLLPRSMAGALIEIARRKYPKKGEEFIEKIYLGGMADDAAFDMRERLIHLSITKGQKLSRSYIFGLLIKSFMLYVTGKRTGVLKISEGEEYPRIQ